MWASFTENERGPACAVGEPSHIVWWEPAKGQHIVWWELTKDRFPTRPRRLDRTSLLSCNFHAMTMAPATLVFAPIPLGEVVRGVIA